MTIEELEYRVATLENKNEALVEKISYLQSYLEDRINDVRFDNERSIGSLESKVDGLEHTVRYG